MPGVVSPVCISAGIVVTLALVIPAFYSVEPLAGLLMLPYLAWATFALYLNSTLIKMNPQVCTDLVMTLPNPVISGYNDSVLSRSRHGGLYGVQTRAGLAAKGCALNKGVPGKAMTSRRNLLRRS